MTTNGDARGAGRGGESVYLRVGGEAGVRALVEDFYRRMDGEPAYAELRALHPPDLARSVDSLFKFLSGWFGGPPLFEQERGHPRLRARHLPFVIGTRERDQWMDCMRAAVGAVVADERVREAMLGAFQAMADHMINDA